MGSLKVILRIFFQNQLTHEQDRQVHIKFSLPVQISTYPQHL
jgi:hypothetical protein